MNRADLFFVSRTREIKKEREKKKEKDSKNNRSIVQFVPFQITESSIRCGATLSFFFFFFLDPSPADGGRWEAVSMFTREIVRVVLSCGRGGGRIRGKSVYQCAAGATTAPAGPATTAAPTKENSLIHILKFSPQTLLTIPQYSYTSFEALLRWCITHSTWMKFTITRSLNTNQINPYNYL